MRKDPQRFERVERIRYASFDRDTLGNRRQTLAGNGEIIEIAFLVCSLLQGGECKDVHLRFYSQAPPSVFECALYGQAAMAKWVVENPNWSVARGYRCGPPSKLVKL